MDPAREPPSESRRILRTLLSNLPGMAYRCRNVPSWSMEFASEGAVALTGHSPAELVDGDVEYGDLILPEDRRAVWDRVQEAVAVRRPFRVVYRIRTADGKLKRVWEQGRGVFDEEGGLLALEGFITDISDRRELEEQLEQAQKMEAVGQLAGGIAHDFNNLLTVIQGYSDVLLRELAGNERLGDKVREIRRASDRAASLTRQLLAFSRRQVLHLRVTNLNDVIEETGRMVDRLLGPRIEVEFDLQADLWPVRADADQVSQVLVNLAVNARDAMPDGGRLTFRTENVSGEAEGRRVVLTVADTGSGIPSEIRTRIFEPFFTTKGHGKGTGLGLSTVYGIVTQFGGSVDVESEPGRGTAFRIVMPVTEDPLDPAGDDALATPVPSGERILLVEDEPGVRELVTTVLAESGYELATAASGAEALALFRAGPARPALLLTDLSMPGMDGRELARAVLAEDPTVRVLYMTGFSEALTAGAAEGGYLAKPFSPAALVRAVRRALAGPDGGEG